MYEVDSLELLDSKARLENIAIDPVGEYRRLAAEKAAKEAEEAAMNDPNHRAKVEAEQRKAESLAMPKMGTPGSSGSADIEEPSLPAMDVQSDSLALSDTTAASDSLAVTDSLAVEPLDTTKIGFLEALRTCVYLITICRLFVILLYIPILILLHVCMWILWCGRILCVSMLQTA